MFAIYPSEYDPFTLDEVADSYLQGIETIGSVSRSYTVVNGVSAIQVSFVYFDTIWECTSHSTYMALFDNQTRLFELDSQACEGNVAVAEAIFEEMRNSFKP